MKKRVKLLTTIASLCLAVALMAFGVYAASSSTLTVSSSVSFTSNEVQVKWTWSVDGGSLTAPIAGNFSTTAEGEAEDKTVSLMKEIPGEEEGDPSTYENITFNTADEADGKLITYLFTCENISGEDVKVSVGGAGHALFTEADNDNVTITYYVDQNDGTTEGAWAGNAGTTTYTLTAATKGQEGYTGGGKVYFKVTVALDDATKDVAETSITAVFKAEKA